MRVSRSCLFTNPSANKPPLGTKLGKPQYAKTCSALPLCTRLSNSERRIPEVSSSRLTLCKRISQQVKPESDVNRARGAAPNASERVRDCLLLLLRLTRLPHHVAIGATLAMASMPFDMYSMSWEELAGRTPLEFLYCNEATYEPPVYTTQSASRPLQSLQRLPRPKAWHWPQHDIGFS